MPTTITGTDGVSQVQAGAVESGDLASGAIGSGDLPAGSVIQVVQVSDDTLRRTTSDYPQTSGITASITPSSASSKIYVLVICSVFLEDEGSNSNKIAFLGIKNNTSGVELNKARYSVHLSNATRDAANMVSFSHLDSPNSTSSQTYEILFGRVNSTFDNPVELRNEVGSASTITLMEIAG